MAIAQMAKIIIVSHRSQASELLEALQREGICHILNADEAIVSRDFPDINASAERPKDIEGMLSRLEKSIAFLGKYAQAQKGLASVLSPRTVIDEQSYDKVVSDRKIQNTIGQNAPQRQGHRSGSLNRMLLLQIFRLLQNRQDRV